MKCLELKKDKGIILDIDEYLWRNRISQRDFAKQVGIAPHTLCKIKRRQSTPLLATALKIVKESNDQIDLETLLSEKHARDLDIEIKRSR